MALSDKWLRSHLNKPQTKRFEKSHRDGLSVRLSLNGAITFQYRYYLRDLKKYDRATIGYYPEMSLSAAAAELPRLKVMLAEGKNPKLELASSRIFESKKLTLNELFYQWYELNCKKNKKAHAEHYRSYIIYVQDKLGKLIAENISQPVFINIFSSIAKKTPSIAARLIIDLKQMYTFGKMYQFIEKNPLQELSAKHLGISAGQDTRFFDEQEIIWFYYALDKTNISNKNKIFIKLLFHYGCRPNELRLTEIKHVNLDFCLWTVPWQNHKTGKKTKQPIIRPIIDEIKTLWQQAIELSGSRKWLFTNRTSNNLINRYSIKSSIKCIETYWYKHLNQNDVPIVFESFHPYTLRKTARTNWSDFGDWAVCEKMVGHKLPGETDKYDYNNYAEKMRPVYQQWYNYTQRLRNGESKVTTKLNKYNNTFN